MSRSAHTIGVPRYRTGSLLSTVDPPPYKSVGRVVRYGGYLYEFRPEHRRPNLWGYVQQHRLVAEHSLRRPLTHSEVVHHEDENKTNNLPANLRVFGDQASHMRFHKQDSHRWNPAFVESVRKSAGDPKVSMMDLANNLRVNVQTIRAILDVHSIPWTSANGALLSEESVRAALQGRTTAEAADLLGVNHQTLRNRFGHLLQKRASPGFLDAQKEEIRSRSRLHTLSCVARQLDLCYETLRLHYRHWLREEPDAWSGVLASQPGRLAAKHSSRCKASSPFCGLR